MRCRIQIDAHGVPLAYRIRKAEPYDWYLALEGNTWERVECYDDGWSRVIHDYDCVGLH